MSLRLNNVQKLDAEAQIIRAEGLKKGKNKYFDVNRVLHYLRLLFVLEII